MQSTAEIPLVVPLPADLFADLIQSARESRDNPSALIVAVLRRAFPAGGAPPYEMPPDDTIVPDEDLSGDPMALHTTPAVPIRLGSPQKSAPPAPAVGHHQAARSAAAVPRAPDGTAYDDMIL